MSAMKKGTKLTDTPKDFMLRTRLDKDTLNMLDEVCKVKNQSRSEVVREGIRIQYQDVTKTS